MNEGQKVAIRMLNEGHKITEVAEVLGITKYQVEKWLEDPWFRREQYLDMRSIMQESVPMAVRTLLAISKGEVEECRAADRLKASLEILDRAGYSVRKELEVTVTDTRKLPLSDMDEKQLVEYMELLKQQAAAIDVTPDPPKEIEDKKCDNP